MASNSKLNEIYQSIKQRSFNPNCKDYKDYGACGIMICDEWANNEWSGLGHRTKGWLMFKTWALNNGYQEGLSIDRIDNNKGYSPDNCRWVTQKIQANNRTNNRVITYKGKNQTLAQWVEELDCNYNTVYQRLLKGWPVEKAFETN